jgi:hypothetical protein
MLGIGRQGSKSLLSRLSMRRDFCKGLLLFWSLCSVDFFLVLEGMYFSLDERSGVVELYIVFIFA